MWYNYVMRVFISHQSALEYWRKQLALPHDSARRRCSVMLADNPPSTEYVKLLGLSLPLSIMLRKDNRRWASKCMKQHVFTGETPEGCFVNVKDGVFVSSPEFCFFQMASQLSLVGLIVLGYELCGGYSMPAANSPDVPERGFHLRSPLTNTKKLKAFISRMRGVNGHQKALRALRFILEGSASPMETKLAILLTLPYSLGGFGLPKPELNARIILSKAAENVSNKEFYRCDLFWPEQNIAVEYDSDLFHTGSKQISEDSKKRNALMTMGINVISVTKSQFSNTIEFEKAARVIANRIGKRMVYKYPKFLYAYNDLYDLLQCIGSMP